MEIPDLKHAYCEAPSRIGIEQRTGLSGFWGVSAAEVQEEGWSVRRDNDCLTLISDGDVWYFGNEADENVLVSMVASIAPQVCPISPVVSIAAASVV